MKKVRIIVLLLAVSCLVGSVQAAIYTEDFETGIDGWTQLWAGSADQQVVAQDPEGDPLYPHGGSGMATAVVVNNWEKSVMQHSLSQPTQGTATFWVSWNFRVDYGTTAATKPSFVEVTGTGAFSYFMNMPNPGATDTRNNWLGYRTYGGNVNTGDTLTAIQLVRDTWYEAKFVVDDNGLKGYWDNALIFTNPNITDITALDFGSNSATDPVSGASSNGMFVDDISVTPEPATLCLLAIGGLFLRRKRS
jgi:hypothetical protein